jgi:AAA+ ATPase superfamily predicted ATPase
MAQFVDRDVELDQLTDCYESETADFVVIYGRRRLGKSELVRQSIADRDDAVYHQAVESTAPNQLEQFVDTATAQFPSLQNVRRDWEALLETLGNQDQLQMLGDDAYDELVAPELADYVSPLFERLCQQALPNLVDRQFRDVGQWWFKEYELDVLGLTDEGLVAGECKFTSQPVSEGVLADLERTASEVRWSKEPADGKTLYVLFSRSGYTDDLEITANSRGDVRLFELPDLMATDRYTNA